MLTHVLSSRRRSRGPFISAGSVAIASCFVFFLAACNRASGTAGESDSLPDVDDGPGVCDDIPECVGDASTNGCVDCALLGDERIASNGGACFEPWAECYGPQLDVNGCDGGNPECCALDDCTSACDKNRSGVLEPGEELDCACTNDGALCAETSEPGTCAGDLPEAWRLRGVIVFCLQATCPTACQ
jgi:hypothetical protein